MRRTITAPLAALVLTACGATVPPPSAPPSAAPSGATLAEVTARGTIKPIQVKLYDVGTHVLVSAATNDLLYILASTAVDLGAHVGEEVELLGTTMPLGGGRDTLLSVSTLRAVTADDALVETAKRLAASTTPPYTFAPTDPAEIVSRTPTAAVVRVRQTLASYRLSLSLVGSDWVLTSVELEADVPSSTPAISAPPSSSVTPVPSSAPLSPPSSVAEPVSSAPPSQVPTPVPPAPTQVSPSATPEDTAAVQVLTSGLPGLLQGAGVPASSPRATKVSLTATRKAYVEYSDGDARGMLLVGWSSDPASASVLATFVPGETADWEKATGDNSAKGEALTIFTVQGGAWTPEVTTAAGYTVYKNSGLKLSLQYPSHWYYSSLAAPASVTKRIGFSDKPVTEENALVTVDVVPGALDTVVGSYSGVVATTVEGKEAFRGTVPTGETVVLIARDGASTLVLTAKPDAAGRMDTIAGSIVSE